MKAAINRFDTLTTTQIWAYSVGHFINDLTSTCCYLLIYLKIVVHTEASSMAILAGQIADALATPIIGFISDKTRSRWGKRKPWYIFGLVTILVAFIPTFQNVKSLFPDISQSLAYSYYIFFPSLFNIGWASLQISHMSLVPSLTCSRKRRDMLNNRRNTFTFIANLTVLLSGYFLFNFLNKSDLQFQLIALIAVTLGLLTSLIFLFFISQVKIQNSTIECRQAIKQSLNQQESSDISSLAGQEMFSPLLPVKTQESIYQWFKMPKFYLFGVSYMGARMYCNLYGTLFQFYLIYIVKLATPKQISQNKVPVEMALIPLTTYTFSVITSMFLSFLYSRIGRKYVILCGMILTIICDISLAFINQNTFIGVLYLISGFIGVSQSMILSTSINLISDVVGDKSKKGAFVFGCYSFLQKLANGIAIYLLTNNLNNQSQVSQKYVRFSNILAPGLSCILSCAIILLSRVEQYKKLKIKGLKDQERSQSLLRSELV